MLNEVGNVAAWHRMDCLVVGTKVVVQSVCGHIHIRAIAGCLLHIRTHNKCLAVGLAPGSHTAEFTRRNSATVIRKGTGLTNSYL